MPQLAESSPAERLKELSGSRVTVIEAGGANRDYFRDLWRYRELFFILIWRDLSIRYKQMALGLGWAILRPLLTALVFALVFGKLVKVPSGGMPHAPYIYAALVPWLFFASTVSDISTCLQTHAALISKVYFPRLLAPLVATAVALIDLVIAIALLLPMLWVFHVHLSWRLSALLPLTVMTIGLSLGLGLCFAAMNLKYRDTSLVLPYVLQFGLYLSPIIFPSDLVPYPWRLLYSMNPIVGVIEGYRWAAFPHQLVDSSAIAISAMMSVLFLLLGFRYFPLKIYCLCTCGAGCHFGF